MTTNWHEFAEELIRDLGDAVREFKDLDVVLLEFDLAGKTAKLVGPRDGGDVFVEHVEVEEIIDDLADRWQRKLNLAELEDARGAVAA